SADDASRHDDYIASYHRGNPPKVIGIGREVIGRRKDATTFPLHLSVGEAKFPGGHLFTGILRDLTQVKQLEREFLQSQKMEVVGRLASGIAHDFNNLLMGITGCAEMALTHLDDDHPARAPIDSLCRASSRGGALVRRLLSFSSKPLNHKQATDVGHLVRELGPMLERILGENVALNLVAPPDPIWVRCAEGEVEQVLMNLVINARHAMPRGGRIDLEVHAPTKESELAQLVVRDTGCGMDAETQSRVFEPFFTTREGGEGTGLGLSTVYGIVERSGGSIELWSRPGEGTCFRVFFPLAQAPAEVQEPVTGSPAEATHILIVEDDDLVRMTLRYYLEKHDYKVHEAASGETALEILQTPGTPITVLVTDMVLPGISGSDLSRKTAKKDLATVFMSAYDPEHLRREGAITARDVAINKPFGEQELLDAIARARAARVVLEPRESPGATAAIHEAQARKPLTRDHR
ncbi:MAG: hybrid sensor histidine kinase/response regulator, partial [Nannocystaceae bacterium]